MEKQDVGVSHDHVTHWVCVRERMYRSLEKSIIILAEGVIGVLKNKEALKNCENNYFSTKYHTPRSD